MPPLKTIDVAIGVAFLYLLLTFVASALVEMLSVVRNWRAQILHDAIANMLTGSDLLDVDDIYDCPLVLALSRNGAARSPLDFGEHFGWRPCQGGTPPSYMPAATFSGAVLAGLIRRAKAIPDFSPEGMVELIRETLLDQESTNGPKADQQDALKCTLETTLATQGPSIQALRFALEKWYNDTMDRASGWYKRRTQYCLLLIGLIVAFSFNINTVTIARWLWQGDAARQAIVSGATEYLTKNPPAPATTTGGNATSQNGSKTTVATLAGQIVSVDQQVVNLQYPIGWQPADRNISWYLQYLCGCFITAVAISMGSTFWFDALQQLVKIRSAGPKPASR